MINTKNHYRMSTGRCVWLSENNFWKILKDKDKRIDKLNNRIMDVEDELNETTERLITENEKLKKDKEILQENIDLLKKQLELAHIHINKNSSNSNCPAAHDNPYGKTKKVICSARTKTNLKRGGQKGHTGHFGKLSKNPDEIITHHNEPPPRNGFVDLVNNKIITQVKEMEFKTRIIQHEYTFDDGTKVSSFKILPNAYTYGNSVKSFVIWLANQGFVAINRISEFIKQLSKGEIEISDATIASISLECAQKLENINRELQHDVKNTDVLHFDETCVKLNGKLVTIQGYANSKTTYLMAANTKCNQTLYAFLSDYHNWLVVDYCKPYQKLESHCKIAGCNAHIDRYLRRMSQEFHIEEATVMQKFLHKLLATPKVMDLDAIKCEYLRICDSFLDKYESMNKNDQIYYKDAHLLFKRLKEKMHQHLAFVSNNVPYTNNMIERDFRHMKTKMKVSGTFRSWDHTVAFATIYSFFKTCSKRHINLWTAINQIWVNDFKFN